MTAKYTSLALLLLFILALALASAGQVGRAQELYTARGDITGPLEWQNVFIPMSSEGSNRVRGADGNSLAEILKAGIPDSSQVKIKLGEFTLFHTLNARQKISWALDFVTSPRAAKNRRVMTSLPIHDLQAEQIDSVLEHVASLPPGNIRAAILWSTPNALVHSNYALGRPIKWNKKFANALRETSKALNEHPDQAWGITYKAARGITYKALERIRLAGFEGTAPRVIGYLGEDGPPAEVSALVTSLGPDAVEGTYEFYLALDSLPRDVVPLGTKVVVAEFAWPTKDD